MPRSMPHILFIRYKQLVNRVENRWRQDPRGIAQNFVGRVNDLCVEIVETTMGIRAYPVREETKNGITETRRRLRNFYDDILQATRAMADPLQLCA